eukprot:scaffold3856_cov276-Prasinococcus_capsulatus_cf.AAC.4
MNAAVDASASRNILMPGPPPPDSMCERDPALGRTSHGMETSFKAGPPPPRESGPRPLGSPAPPQ